MDAMPVLRVIGAVTVAVLLSSCGGGGGGGDGGAAPPTTSEIICRPVETGYPEEFLDQSTGGDGTGGVGGVGGDGGGVGVGSGDGAIQYAEVRLYDSTGTLIGTALSDEKGLARLRSCGTNGPFRVEYVGNERTRYFDEGIAARAGSDAAAWVPFGVGEKITVYVTNLDNHVALTPLTNAAAAEVARASAGAYPTAAIVSAANENARTRFNALFAGSGIVVDDITRAPALAYSIESLTRFGTNGRGRYGQMLAALAKSAAQSNPGLANPGREMNRQLTLDLSDGTVDGRDAAGAPVAPEPLRAYVPQQLTAAVTVQSAGRLNTVSIGSGTVARSVSAAVCSLGGGNCYPWATEVTLTAQPASGFQFQNWSGACTGSSPVCNVTMSGDKSVSATFAPISSQNFTLSAQVAGNGFIASTPGGIACPGTCGAQYASGTVVALNASAALGSAFAGWSGACSGTGACVVNLNGNLTVSATFTTAAATSFPLQVQKAGAGQGTVTSSAGGIDCGSNCTASLATGTQVTLTAVAASGSTFAGWSGACTGTGTICSVTMAAARDVTATFGAPPLSGQVLTVTKTGLGQGSVTSSPAGINCGTVCAQGFASGTSVTLTAVADPGWTFGGWSGACLGASSSCTVSMTAARSVTATFNAPSVALTVSKAGTGQGSVTSSPAGINCGTRCNATFVVGTTVTLTANVGPGSVFAGWTGACAGLNSTCTVSLSAARAVTATFDIDPTSVVLTVSKTGAGSGTVRSDIGAIACGSACSAAYTAGTEVTLTATADPGSYLVGWTTSDTSVTGRSEIVVAVNATTTVTATFALASADAWTWIGGSSSPDAPATYGTRGVAAPGNVPGARLSMAYWTDSSGSLWLFGGTGFTSASSLGNLNDLWRFNPGIGQWTWVSGSSTVSALGVYGTQGVAAPGNVPGARSSAGQWIDASGQLWLFGGAGFDSTGRGYLNDLWRFQPATGQWAWVAGSSSINGLGVYGTRGVASAGSTPGARDMATSWIDASGDLWVFGGTGLTATTSARSLNDLWRFRPGTGLWTWVGGSSTADAAGVYGTRGVASVNNMPGGRYGATSWIDPSGFVWLFGGYGNDSAGAFGLLNDLWRFNPATGQWAWVSGADTRAAPGVYGTLGTPAADNTPGARALPTYWTDGSGNLWLFGGYGYGASATFGDLNDIWRFSATSGQWTWVAGSTAPGAPGVYGFKGSPSPDNTPGGRGRAAAWFDRSANLWLFGGASANGEVLHNDLWRRGP